MSNLVQDAITAGTPIYPDVAVNSDGTDNNITDSESGMPNVAATMQTGVPASGWPGNGIPIFNNMNRLFRIVTQWIRWLYENAWHANNTTHVEGAFTSTSHYTENIALPAGYDHTNTVIVGARICLPSFAGGQAQTMVPLVFVNGSDVYAVTAEFTNADIIYVVSNMTSGSGFDLNAGTYHFILKKVS